MGLPACLSDGAGRKGIAVGRTPWSAADAPVGLLAPCKMLIPLFQMRDEGVPRRPGGLPHNVRRIRYGGKNECILMNSTCQPHQRGVVL